MTIKLEQNYCVTGLYEESKIGNEMLLIPKNESAINKVLMFDEFACDLWNRLIGEKLTLNEVFYYILDSYEINFETAKTDIGLFVDKLLMHKAIKLSEDENGQI